MNKELLEKGAHRLGFSLSPEQLDAFAKFFDEIHKWGAKINITALLINEERLIEELFIDSLSPLLAISPLRNEKPSLLDIGSGGGFPGLPLKIAAPSVSVVLTDSIEKKIFFLRNTIRKLTLNEATALCVRFKSTPSPLLPLSSFDWVTSKAVTDMWHLAKWAHPFLKKGGHLICLKSPVKSPPHPAGFAKPAEITYFLPFNNIERKLFVYKKL